MLEAQVVESAEDDVALSELSERAETSTINRRARVFE